MITMSIRQKLCFEKNFLFTGLSIENAVLYVKTILMTLADNETR